MPRKIVWFLALLCLSTVVLHSQHKEARNRLAAAHGQYYTPTASGLKSFHCDASIDWQAMLSRFTGSEIPDGSPALKALFGRAPRRQRRSEIDATFCIEYVKVDSHQLPSRVTFDIKNTGVTEISFSACKTTVADWAKKPS